MGFLEEVQELEAVRANRKVGDIKRAKEPVNGVHCLDVSVLDVMTYVLFGDRNSKKESIVVRNSDVQALQMGGSCAS